MRCQLFAYCKEFAFSRVSLFPFLGSLNDHKRSPNYLKRSLSINIDHHYFSSTTYSKPLTYRNLTKSISPSLTTTMTYNNTQRSKQLHQPSCRPLTYHDCTFLFAFIWKLGNVGKHE